MKFLTILCFAFPLLGFLQDSLTNHDKIYSSAQRKLISPDDIVNDMDRADVLFFGEEHNDSTGHYLEYALFKKLFNKYPGDLALSMEMFQTDVQVLLNEYLEDLISDKTLTTDARTWPN